MATLNSKALDYRPTFLTYSLGCRVNQAEMNQIGASLAKAGLLPWSEDIGRDPSVIILNTCVVTQKAEKETRQTIRHLKRTFPKSFLLVTGCAIDAQEKLNVQLPNADLFVTNKNKSQIIKIITQKFSPKKHRHVSMKRKRRAFVKIQDGCNQFCTFCIVPYLRGQSKSKPIAQVIKEIKKLEKENILEIILCGINLSLYGQDLEPPATLPLLLKTILKRTDVPRISLSSLTPNLINEELINLYIKNYRNGKKRLSSYFHIALQSGSEKILTKMNRPEADLNKLKSLLHYIKQEIPAFNLRADIIVGFPGETGKDFQETLHYIEALKISFGHIFRYSPRPGTVAYKMIKSGQWTDIDEKTKKKRSQKVRETIKSIRQQEGEKLVGQNLNCLVLDKRGDVWRGLADNFWPVEISGQGEAGQILPVKITAHKDQSLRGTSLLP